MKLNKAHIVLFFCLLTFVISTECKSQSRQWRIKAWECPHSGKVKAKGAITIQGDSIHMIITSPDGVWNDELHEKIINIFIYPQKYIEVFEFFSDGKYRYLAKDPNHPWLYYWYKGEDARIHVYKPLPKT